MRPELGRKGAGSDHPPHFPFGHPCPADDQVTALWNGDQPGVSQRDTLELMLVYLWNGSPLFLFGAGTQSQHGPLHCGNSQPDCGASLMILGEAWCHSSKGITGP
ncbi:hypothetical protein HYQ46_007768 [Verticillium longisporum]|nr:hypothetical protein HYQ46_007768 [Verticillium longisporum]